MHTRRAVLTTKGQLKNPQVQKVLSTETVPALRPHFVVRQRAANAVRVPRAPIHVTHSRGSVFDEPRPFFTAQRCRDLRVAYLTEKSLSVDCWCDRARHALHRDFAYSAKAGTLKNTGADDQLTNSFRRTRTCKLRTSIHMKFATERSQSIKERKMTVIIGMGSSCKKLLIFGVHICAHFQ